MSAQRPANGTLVGLRLRRVRIRSLRLSEHAEVAAGPRVGNLADDVKGTHGATVGRLDEDAVFYLRSRGVPHPAARGLLIYAFANEMVERLRPEPLRAQLETRVAGRFAQGDPTVEP